MEQSKIVLDDGCVIPVPEELPQCGDPPPFSDCLPQREVLTSDPTDCNGLSALVGGRDCCAFAEFPRSWTFLHYAARDAVGSVIQSLLNGGVDIEAATTDRSRPLHVAAEAGNQQAIIVLAKAGADVEAKDMLGMTPLHCAVQFQKLDAIRALAESHADIDGREETASQWTPLHRAAFWGDSASIKLLGELCADVNVQDSQGRTPLHIAANAEKLEAIQSLIELGANCTMEDNKGTMPLGSRDELPELCRTEKGQQPQNMTSDPLEPNCDEGAAPVDRLACVLERRKSP